ncbi:hypothetical protein FRC0497_02156 [Corynebacterium diphtheriae]|nr:hypothetical protein FRC0497_02156 [Corynebacterium diphtheriae]
MLDTKNKLNMPWLRFIEGAQSGAANTVENTDTQHTGEQPNDEAVDYKAKYEAMKAHSREWETKAKENFSAAKRLKELEDAEKTELEKLGDQLASVTKERDASNAELSRLRIASKHGISAEDAEMFLHGDAETMEAQAAALAARASDQAKKPDQVLVSAEDPLQGRGGEIDKRAAAKAWAKSLFDKK